MICLTDLLEDPINDGCDAQLVGLESVGYIFPYSNLVKGTVTDLVASFTGSGAVEVYQPFEMRYKPKSEGEKNEYGLMKYAKTIEVFTAKNSKLTQEQLLQLTNDDWVLVLKDKNAQYLVFGYERGLTLITSSQELLSTSTHGGILLTFTEKYVNTPMLFTTADVFNSLTFPQVGDEYQSGIVAAADPVSGEILIAAKWQDVIDVGNGGAVLAWADAVTEVATIGGYSYNALPNRVQALQIFENAEIVTQIGIPDFGVTPYWTSEEKDNDYAYDANGDVIEESGKENEYYALPVRVVNFYKLPLIGSEYGGGLVYDVVAETQTVHVLPYWSDVNATTVADWDTRVDDALSESIGIYDDWQLPTRAQATKIFENISLVALAGLPTESIFWTSEVVEGEEENAYAYDTTIGQIDSYGKIELYYGLPVRSEVFGT